MTMERAFQAIVVAMAVVLSDSALRAAEAPYADEARFYREGRIRPALCISASGGGLRSAAFTIGILAGLEAEGVLTDVDIMSAVSGGSWALWWYYLQQFAEVERNPIHPREMDRIRHALFDPAGPWQESLSRHFRLVGGLSAQFEDETYALAAEVASKLTLEVVALSLMPVGMALSPFSLPRIDFRPPALSGYASSIDRAFMRHPATPGGRDDPFDEGPTIMVLSLFIEMYRLPAFVVGGTWYTDDDLESSAPTPPSRLMELTPLWIGSPELSFYRWEDIAVADLLDGFARTIGRSADWNLNTFPALSGAALSEIAPDMDRPTRTVLDLLGWGQDLRQIWPPPLWYIPEQNPSVLTFADGGFAENLALLPLLDRSCAHIIVIDAEHDPLYQFEAREKLTKFLERERNGFFRPRGSHDGMSSPVSYWTATSHAGSTREPRSSEVLYVKLQVDEQDGSMPSAVRGYRSRHPMFPQQPTFDLSYDVEQYAAYRDLGTHIVRRYSAAFHEFSEHPRP